MNNFESTDLKIKYINEFSLIWPEQKELITDVLSKLSEVQEVNIFTEFCENIRSIVESRDLEKLKLSVNLARRMNVMVKGEQSDNSSKSFSHWKWISLITISVLFIIYLMSRYIF